MDVAEGIDDDQEADERGDDGHEDRQRVDDQDEVQPQDELLADDGLAAARGCRDEEQGEERGDAADQDGPGRPGGFGDEAGQRDGQGANDWDKNSEKCYCLNVHFEGQVYLFSKGNVKAFLKQKKKLFLGLFEAD